MAVTAVSALYPPILPTFVPAFLNTSSPKIYFELSPYMSVGEARRMHVSLVNQNTNESALKQEVGILVVDIEYDEDKNTNFITIPWDEVKNSTDSVGWLTNCYYKLQLRFDSNDEKPTQYTSSYFNDYNQYFSEWSTVCLLRAIQEPKLLLNVFDSEGVDGKIAFNKGIVPISGQVFFGNEIVPTEKDQIQSFRICVMPRGTAISPIYVDSGEIFTGNQVNPNSLNYNLDLAGMTTDEETKFKFRVYYLTRNLYQGYKDYNFEIAEYVADDSFGPDITIELKEEVGAAILHVENWMSLFGKIYIRRSSNLSNFKDWEMIREEIVAGPLDISIYDNTLQSGVYYRYIIQFENIRGGITPIVYSAKFAPNFFGPFLSRGDKQIHIQYNYTISNMKPVVNRQKLDTIGGKYPKFAENAAMNYKQYSITAMISSQEDEFKTFLKEKDYWGEEYGNYQVYLEQHNVTVPDYNQLWEREFRDSLVAWLNDGEPKLYRSQPEGNVVVMLSDITLTPIASMSRRLWNFTATMTEVAEADSLTKLDELGIYDCRTLADQNTEGLGPGGEEMEVPDYVDVTTVGQVVTMPVDEMVTGNVDIINNYLMPNLQAKYSGILAKRFPIDGYLTNVKIQFVSKPHLFLQRSEGGQLLLVDDIKNYSEDEKKRMMLGYSFEVNAQGSPNASRTFFVNQKGYFQIPKTIDVRSLFFPQSDDIVHLEYLFNYKEKNDSSTIVTSSSTEKVLVSQQNQTYQPGNWIAGLIKRKHTYTVPDQYYQRMEWWRGISIDCAPYAVVELIYENEELGQQITLEVGFSGVLDLLKTVPTSDLRFMGRRMHKVDMRRQPYAEDWEYCLDDSGQDYTSVVEIEKPKMHVVYTIGGRQWIYYTNNHFYEIEQQSNDTILAKVPVDGLVNYYGAVIRDSYV